jgi:hypothetical protein
MAAAARATRARRRIIPRRGGESLHRDRVHPGGKRYTSTRSKNKSRRDDATASAVGSSCSSSPSSSHYSSFHRSHPSQVKPIDAHGR